MNNYEFVAGRRTQIEVDHDSPDRVTARAEALHETDVDFDADLGPDPGETLDLNQIRAIPRDALKTLLRFLVPPINRHPTKRWRVGTVRLALLARMVNLDNLSSLSLEQLGKELGYTRALLSLRDLEIVDELALSKDLLGKQRVARESYSQATTDYWRSAAGTERRENSKQNKTTNKSNLKASQHAL